MPDAGFAVLAVLGLSIVLALLAVRFGMLLGARLGRRLEREDQEEEAGGGPAS